MATLVLLDDGQSAHQRSWIRLSQLDAAIDVLPEFVLEKLAKRENVFKAIAVNLVRKRLQSRGEKGETCISSEEIALICVFRFCIHE